MVEDKKVAVAAKEVEVKAVKKSVIKFKEDTKHSEKIRLAILDVLNDIEADEGLVANKSRLEGYTLCADGCGLVSLSRDLRLKSRDEESLNRAIQHLSNILVCELNTFSENRTDK